MEFTILFFTGLGFWLGRVTKRPQVETIVREPVKTAAEKLTDKKSVEPIPFPVADEASVEVITAPKKRRSYTNNRPGSQVPWELEGAEDAWEQATEDAWEQATEDAWAQADGSITLPVPTLEPSHRGVEEPAVIETADPVDAGVALLLPAGDDDPDIPTSAGWRAFLSFENLIFLLGALTTIGGALYTAASSWSSAATAMRYGMVEGLLGLVGAICTLFGWRLGKSEDTQPAARALSVTVAVLGALTAAAGAVALHIHLPFALLGLAAGAGLGWAATRGLGVKQAWRYPMALLSLGVFSALAGAHIALGAAAAALGVWTLLPTSTDDDPTVAYRGLLLMLCLGALPLVAWQLGLHAAVLGPALALVTLAGASWSRRFATAPVLMVVFAAAGVAVCGLDHVTSAFVTLLIGFVGLWRGMVVTDPNTGDSELHSLVAVAVVIAGGAIAVFWAPALGLLMPSGWTTAVTGTLQGMALQLATAWDGLAILAVSAVAIGTAAWPLRDREHERFTARAIAMVTLCLALLTVVTSVTVQPLPATLVVWLTTGLLAWLGRTMNNALTTVATGLGIVACALTGFSMGWDQWWLGAFAGAVVTSLVGTRVATRLLGAAAIVGCLALSIGLGGLPSLWPTIIAATFTVLAVVATRQLPTHVVVLPSVVGTVMVAALTSGLWADGVPMALLPLLASIPLLVVGLIASTTRAWDQVEQPASALAGIGMAAAMVMAFNPTHPDMVGWSVAATLANALAFILGLRNAMQRALDSGADSPVDGLATVEMVTTALLALPTLALPSSLHGIGVGIVTASGLWLGRKNHVSERIAPVAQPLGWWLLLTAATWAGWLSGGISGALLGGTGLTLLTSFCAPISKLARRHANEASVVATALFGIGTAVVLLPDIGQLLPVTVSAALAAGIGVLFATGPGVLADAPDQKRPLHLAMASLLGLPAMGLSGPFEWIGPGLLVVGAAWLFLRRDRLFPGDAVGEQVLSWFVVAGATAWSGWLLLGPVGPFTAVSGLALLTMVGLRFSDKLRRYDASLLATQLLLAAAAIAGIVEPTVGSLMLAPLPLSVALMGGFALATQANDERKLGHTFAVLGLFGPMVLAGPAFYPLAALVAGVSALYVIIQRGRGQLPSTFALTAWWQLGVAIAVGGWLSDALAGATLGLGVFTIVLMLARTRWRAVVDDTGYLPEVTSVLVLLSAAWSTFVAPIGPVHLPLVFGWGLAVAVSLALAFGRRPAFGTYLTEASLGGLFAMLRYRTSLLDGLAGYEALFIAGAAIVMVGASQLLRRREDVRFQHAGTAVQRTAMLLPMLIPALLEWHGEWNEAMALMAGGLAHMALARAHKSPVFGFLAAGFAYAAVFPAWVASGSDAWTWSPVIAVGGVVLLALTQIYRKRLGDEASVLRTLGSLTVLGAGAAETLQFATPGPALVLAALAIGTVLAGILLRLRAYVFLGMGFLAADIVLNLTRWGFEDRAVAGFLGVTTGVALIALGAAVAKYKRHIAQRYQEVRQWQW